MQNNTFLEQLFDWFKSNHETINAFNEKANEIAFELSNDIRLMHNPTLKQLADIDMKLDEVVYEFEKYAFIEGVKVGLQVMNGVKGVITERGEAVC